MSDKEYSIVIDNATESVMKDFGNGTRQSIASVWNMGTLNTRDRAAAETEIQRIAAEKLTENAAKESAKGTSPTTRAFAGGKEIAPYNRGALEEKVDPDAETNQSMQPD